MRWAYVKWLDHAKTDGDPLDLEPVVRETIGFVISDQPTFLVLAMDRDDKAQFEYGFAIMRDAILEERDLLPGMLRSKRGGNEWSH